MEAKTRALAGWKGYTTNLATCPDGTPVTPEQAKQIIAQHFTVPAHDDFALVFDRDGKKPTQAIPASVASDMAWMMSHVVSEGTARRAI